MIKSTLCLILILVSQTAFAWPPTFGAEFVLTSDEIVSHFVSTEQFKELPSATKEKAAQVRLAEFLEIKCASRDCHIEKIKGKWDIDYLLTFKDGFWIKYSYDPKAVEIMFKPSTIVELTKNQARVDEFVFEAGKQVDLKVLKSLDGHVNMGVNSLFRGNVESFLKYFVDYSNHPDLALNMLGYAPRNAPTLSMLKPEQREALELIVADFYKGKIKTVQLAAARIQKEVYTSSYYEPWGGIHHYQAVGLKYVNETDLSLKDAPMELRGVNAQENMEEFIKLARLVEKRVEYLNKNVKHIIYNKTKKVRFTDKQLYTRFKMYVVESGLDFKDYEFFSDRLKFRGFPPIANKDASPVERLNDLVRYFDLLSASTYVQDQFAEILADPRLQENPRCLAYQKYFEKGVLAAPKEAGLIMKLLLFVGLSRPEAVEHVNEVNIIKLRKIVHEKISVLKANHLKAALTSTIPALKAVTENKIFRCASLFN